MYAIMHCQNAIFINCPGNVASFMVCEHKSIAARCQCNSLQSQWYSLEGVSIHHSLPAEESDDHFLYQRTNALILVRRYPSFSNPMAALKFGLRIVDVHP